MSLVSGTSKIEIISQAFGLLGKENPVHIDDESPTVATASKLYDTFLLKAFSSHPWRFAMEPAKELSQLVEPPPIDTWQFAYQLPENFLILYRLRPLNFTDFEIFKDQLFCDIDSPLYMDYIRTIDESNFPSYFVTYMITYLASKIALQVTQNAEIAVAWSQQADIELAQARNLDSQQMPNPFVRSNQIWSAHRGL
jgi:hypothetical protein